jgi:hypothetical protein
MKDLRQSPKVPRESMPEERTARDFSKSLADSPQVR